MYPKRYLDMLNKENNVLQNVCIKCDVIYRGCKDFPLFGFEDFLGQNVNICFCCIAGKRSSRNLLKTARKWKTKSRIPLSVQEKIRRLLEFNQTSNLLPFPELQKRTPEKLEKMLLQSSPQLLRNAAQYLENSVSNTTLIKKKLPYSVRKLIQQQQKDAYRDHIVISSIK